MHDGGHHLISIPALAAGSNVPKGRSLTDLEKPVGTQGRLLTPQTTLETVCHRTPS